MQIKSPREQLVVNTFRFTGWDSADCISHGSGFVVSHHLPGSGMEYFLVTNRHVAHGAVKASCQIATPKGRFPHSCFLGGSTEILTPPDAARGWFGHPKSEVDIAVYRLKNDPRFSNDDMQSLDYAAISTAIFAAGNPDVDMCAAVVFVGYPHGLIDTKNATPIFRQGVVASPPSLDWEGEKQFLIDASIFPGSSGSPVFAVADGSVVQFKGRQIMLLGVVTAVLTYDTEGQLVTRTVPVSAQGAVAFRDYLNLGVVTKASCVLETITTVLNGTAPRL